MFKSLETKIKQDTKFRDQNNISTKFIYPKNIVSKVEKRNLVSNQLRIEYLKYVKKNSFCKYIFFSVSSIYH